MSSLPTVKINDPNKPGDYIVINESAYREGVHTLFDGSVRVPEPEPDTGLPDGYTVEKLAGGYYYLFGPDGERIDGPSNGKWQGFDGARQAAEAHVELAG